MPGFIENNGYIPTFAAGGVGANVLLDETSDPLLDESSGQLLDET